MKVLGVLLAATCALATFTAGPCRADFMEVPLPQAVAQADLVVVGKITAVDEDKPGPEATDKATITVEEVLLGKAGKTVVLVYPGKRVITSEDGRELSVYNSIDIRYRLDQEGVWLLKWDEKAEAYTARFPSSFQSRRGLDAIRKVVAQIKDEQGPAALTDEDRAMIELWITDEGLNTYGDPKDTMYTGGTPLFDEVTGETKDRFAYILDHHPRLLEQLQRRYASKDTPVDRKLQFRIDAWLQEHNLNQYGDPEGTGYPDGSPLLDTKNKVLRERYRYLLDKLPEMRKDFGL